MRTTWFRKCLSRPARQVARSVAILSVALSSLGIIAGPANASRNTTNTWSANSLTGYCGDQTGGYVALAQSMLHSYGTYTLNVDDYWGANSDSATKTFQTQNGLTADGCLGSSTWTTLKGYTVYVFNENCPTGSITQAFNYQTSYGVTYTFYRTGYNAFEPDPSHVTSPVTPYTHYYFDDPLTTAPC